MKVIVIGATGTIGKGIVEKLESSHDVVKASRHGDYACDISVPESIKALFEKTGKVDAVVIAAGDIAFAKFSAMNARKYEMGLNNKLMGQVNTVLIGTEYLNDNGSFTLTSGILSEKPQPTCSSACMVNSAVDGFVRGVAAELPRGIRINSVSPSLVKESGQQIVAMFPMFDPIASADLANYYVESVEGNETGTVYRAGY